tara:strand:- start:575 stop:922 length:348 start_codon:yes stop_codon:yes gene_type:complete
MDIETRVNRLESSCKALEDKIDSYEKLPEYAVELLSIATNIQGSVSSLSGIVTRISTEFMAKLTSMMKGFNRRLSVLTKDVDVESGKLEDVRQKISTVVRPAFSPTPSPQIKDKD